MNTGLQAYLLSVSDEEERVDVAFFIDFCGTRIPVRVDMEMPKNEIRFVNSDGATALVYRFSDT